MGLKILTLLLFVSLHVVSITFYVSVKSGDNKNNGTISFPFKTIQHAINLLEEGDTSIIQQGGYYETLEFKQSGTLVKPIVSKSYQNQSVVVKNVFTKNNWTKHDENIYKTTNKTKILQAFFDDLPEKQTSFPTIKEVLLTKNQCLDSYAITYKTINLSQNFKMKEIENVRFCGIFWNGLIAIGGKVIKKEKDLIKHIDNIDWIQFSLVELTNFNRCIVRYVVPSNFEGQEIQIRFDKLIRKIIGEYNTKNTGPFDSLKIVEHPIDTIQGVNDLYIRFRGTYCIGNFDWFVLYNSKDSIVQQFKDVNCTNPERMQNFYSSVIFPNPSLSSITISYYCAPLSSIEVAITDKYGHHYLTNKTEFSTTDTNEVVIPDFENLNQGLYFVKTKFISKK